jgi:protein SCO1/2
VRPDARQHKASGADHAYHDAKNSVRDVTLRRRWKHVWAAQRYPVTGLVLKIDPAHRTFVASCTAIPGYMDAMVMPIPVRDAKALDALKPSVLVDFTLVVTKDDAYAENLRVHHYQSVELEPLQVQRLQLLAGLGHADAATAELALGAAGSGFYAHRPDRAQRRLVATGGQSAGVLIHLYKLPLPNYCFRLSNNLGRCKNVLRTGWDATWCC